MNAEHSLKTAIPKGEDLDSQTPACEPYPGRRGSAYAQHLRGTLRAMFPLLTTQVSSTRFGPGSWQGGPSRCGVVGEMERKGGKNGTKELTVGV